MLRGTVGSGLYGRAGLSSGSADRSSHQPLARAIVRSQSCTPPPCHLPFDHLWAGTGFWYNPRTQDLVKCKKTVLPFWYTTIRLRAPPSVCDNAPTDLVLYNPELLSAFSTILSEREDSRREFLNNTKTIFFSLRLAVELNRRHGLCQCVHFWSRVRFLSLACTCIAHAACVLFARVCQAITPGGTYKPFVRARGPSSAHCAWVYKHHMQHK